MSGTLYEIMFGIFRCVRCIWYTWR